jgi:hypothetical protein
MKACDHLKDLFVGRGGGGGGNQHESSMNSDQYFSLCIKHVEGGVQVLGDTIITKLGLHKKVVFS